MYADLHGNRCAGDKRCIREWSKKKEQISEQSKKSCRKEEKTLEGAGRKPAHEFVNSKVLEWIYNRREKRLPSCILIMKKIKIIWNFICSKLWVTT